MKLIFNVCTTIFLLHLSVFSSEITSLEEIHRLSIFKSNVFILETETSLFCIDAAYPGQSKRVLDTINTLGKPLKLVLLTHGHIDHCGIAAELKRKTGALIAIHKLDAVNLQRGITPIDSVKTLGYFGKIALPVGKRIFKPDTITPDILLSDGDSLDSYGLRATVLHTPGHTDGSCSFIVEDSIAFVGDLLVSTPLSVDKQCYFAQSWSEIDKSLCTLCNHQFNFAYIGHTAKTVTRDFVLDLCRKISDCSINQQSDSSQEDTFIIQSSEKKQ